MKAQIWGSRIALSAGGGAVLSDSRPLDGIEIGADLVSSNVPGIESIDLDGRRNAR